MSDNRALTDLYIRGLKASDKRQEINDTKIKALAIRVGRSGQKSFVYRYRFGKKVKRFTIGRYPKVKLASDRKAVTELENMLRNGIDPLVEKKRRINTPAPLSVTEMCEIYIDKHLPTLKKTTRDNYKRRIVSRKD